MQRIYEEIGLDFSKSASWADMCEESASVNCVESTSKHETVNSNTSEAMPSGEDESGDNAPGRLMSDLHDRIGLKFRPFTWGDLYDEMSLVSCKEVTEDIDKATSLSKSGHKKLRFHCRNDVRIVREAE